MVGIIMGSDSDLSTMQPAAEILDEFGIRYEIKVVSAHRTPFDMIEYGKSASDRGIKVIIACAGGAAHFARYDCRYNSFTSYRRTCKEFFYEWLRFFIFYCSNATWCACCNGRYWRWEECGYPCRSNYRDC